jgi:hypothetical protein
MAKARLNQELRKTIEKQGVSLERAMGLEPTTFCLASRRSTPELRPRSGLSQPRSWFNLTKSALPVNLREGAHGTSFESWEWGILSQAQHRQNKEERPQKNFWLQST